MLVRTHFDGSWPSQPPFLEGVDGFGSARDPSPGGFDGAI